MAPVRTLYIRNVPDEVAERLELLATQEGLSMNAFVVKELSESSRRAYNRALLADLPEGDASVDEIVAIIREMRGD